MKWSDAIGPLVGAIGALLAVALGAWWQGRSSVRLVRVQAAEAERVWQHQSRHEQLMRLFDDKRASYVRLLTVATNLAQARSELLNDNAIPFGPEELLSELERGPAQQEAKASDEVDETLTMIEILAPHQVYEAAVHLSTTAIEGGGLGHVERAEFIGQVRRDLGIERTAM
ncbi:hypothetical protein [Verrucosispora sp. WMMD1129]|uniref:hypothetical protein n=1 Tax=Verrucosispora sp. WMMD1129 TaxID=3016093 RepID=UPI00249A868F|nr:hypothetical protein [Verrucosispora sp. WMMD1129]WFE44150.1 hypothetical protein O7624_07270 [Verrucosispora sp. WMMD1129]